MLTEGRVELQEDDDVFYNPRMELNRDVTVAALQAWSDSRDVTGYLDVHCAGGVRALRATAEAGYAAMANDVTPDAVELTRRNAAANDVDVEVSRQDANVRMRRGRVDVVDVDPYGSPVPFADSAFSSAASLACFTATDTAPLCGAHASGPRRYDCQPLNTEYHPEMGLRVLVGALARTAAKQDVAVEPVLSHSSDHYHRTYLAVEEGAKAADSALESMGYVAHCRECLRRSSHRGRVYHGHDSCECGAEVDVAGPLWLDAVSEPEFAEETLSHVEDYMGEAKRARKILKTLAGELSTATHYDQHVLTQETGETPVKLDAVLERLRERGFEASAAHYSGHAFKTTAPLEEVLDLVGR